MFRFERGLRPRNRSWGRLRRGPPRPPQIERSRWALLIALVDPALVALPVRLAELPLEELAGGVARQRIHEVDRGRALVVREVPPRVLDDLLGARVGAGPPH